MTVLEIYQLFGFIAAAGFIVVLEQTYLVWRKLRSADWWVFFILVCVLAERQVVGVFRFVGTVEKLKAQGWHPPEHLGWEEIISICEVSAVILLFNVWLYMFRYNLDHVFSVRKKSVPGRDHETSNESARISDPPGS